MIIIPPILPSHCCALYEIPASALCSSTPTRENTSEKPSTKNTLHRKMRQSRFFRGRTSNSFSSVFFSIFLVYFHVIQFNTARAMVWSNVRLRT